MQLNCVPAGEPRGSRFWTHMNPTPGAEGEYPASLIFVSASPITAKQWGKDRKPSKWRIRMESSKNRKLPAMPSSHFRPDRTYINNAMEEYMKMGGRISKLESGSSYYSDMKTDRNLLSKPGPFLDETHVRNPLLVD